MGEFEFTDDLLTGHSDVDRQHRALFTMAGAFAQMDQPTPEVVVKVLKFMLNYVRYHFASEEAVMERISYARMDHHKMQHRIFADRVAEVRKAAADGESLAAVVARLHVMFHDWLVEHIMAMDRPLAETLRAITNDGSLASQRLPTSGELVEEGALPKSSLRIEDIHWDGDGESWIERMKKRPSGSDDR